MALDHFIYFKRGERPSRDGLQLIVEDYLGAFLKEMTWKEDRFIALLHGNKSWPFRRTLPERDVTQPGEERWIEVCFYSGIIDVLTRQADEATNNLADGLVEIIRRYWRTSLKP